MRIRALTAFAAVVALGLVWRSFTTGTTAKAGGDVLYALAVLALLVLLRPRTTPRAAAAVTVAVCWVVEFLQLTPWPAELSARSTIARLVLGSTFHPADLVAYLGGAAIGALAWATMRR